MSLVVNALIGTVNISCVTLCGIMKLPTLYQLIKSNSTHGVSLYSILLEFSGYCIMMSYNIYAGYNLASYLEYPLLVVQDAIILVTLLRYLKLLSVTMIYPSAILIATMIGISLDYFPNALIIILVNCCPFLSASSKIVQLQAIVTSKDSTGVSIPSWSISAYTSIARLVTVYIETNDVSLMINFMVAFFLNMAIIIACIIYSPKRKGTKKID